MLAVNDAGPPLFVPRDSRLRAAGGVLLGLLLVAVTAGFGFRPWSNPAPSYDETAHVAGAYENAFHGSNELNAEHPPLLKQLAGWSLRLAVPLDTKRLDARMEQEDEWHFGQSLLYDRHDLTPAILRAARTPSALFALAGGALVALAAFLVFGRVGAFAAAGLYALSPTIHAYGALLLTDLPAGVLMLAASMCAWRGTRDGHRAWLAAAGAVLAAACWTKVTAVVAVPAIGALLLVHARRGDGTAATANRAASAIVALLAGLVAGFVLLNGGSLDFGAYARGATLLGFNHAPGFPSFANGEFRTESWWGYFPYTMLVKSGLGELVALLLLAPAWLARRNAGAPVVASAGSRGLLAFVLVPALAYLLLVIVAAPNLSHRYVVPAMPALFVVMAAPVAWLSGRLRALALAALLALQATSALAAQPDPLSFFNGLLGCRDIAAIHCLDDTNIDGGQNIARIWPAVAARLAPGEALLVDYYGTAQMTAYLPNFRSLRDADWTAPGPGLYVLSAHYVNRRRLTLEHPESNPLLLGASRDDAIGNSYFIVDLRPQQQR